MGRKPQGPHRFASWAATRRQNTRAIRGSRTKGYTDPVRHIKCARETRDLTPADTAMSVTVRMSLTSAISKLFSTSSRRTYRLKEAGNGLRSSVRYRKSLT